MEKNLQTILGKIRFHLDDKRIKDWRVREKNVLIYTVKVWKMENSTEKNVKKWIKVIFVKKLFFGGTEKNEKNGSDFLKLRISTSGEIFNENFQQKIETQVWLWKFPTFFSLHMKRSLSYLCPRENDSIRFEQKTFKMAWFRTKLFITKWIFSQFNHRKAFRTESIHRMRKTCGLFSLHRLQFISPKRFLINMIWLTRFYHGYLGNLIALISCYSLIYSISFPI